jgi:hypothetical protein
MASFAFPLGLRFMVMTQVATVYSECYATYFILFSAKELRHEVVFSQRELCDRHTICRPLNHG